MASTLIKPQVAVVCPETSLNVTNADGLKQQLIACLNQQQDVFVDMAGVEFLDSAGLVALVSALGFAQRCNQHLYLCSISPAVRIVFELTQLDRAFEILDESAASCAARINPR